MATRSFAMDRELLRTVRQATVNHARLLYLRLVSRLPHLLAVTLLVVAAPLVPSSSPTPSLAAGARALWHEARANAAVVVAACSGLAAAAYAYAASRSRPVYLVDLSGFKPGRSHEATRAKSIRHFALAGLFNEESMAFQTRMLERAGVGEATHFPASLLSVPVDMCLRTAREESETVIFGVVDDLLRKTGVRADDIGVVIVNSSLYSPTPSFTSLVVNRYGLRHDVVSHNLSGMGCSAGIIAIDLAKHLLQVHPDTYALVVSTENITLNAYFGNHRPMLVTNTLFRMGGAAVLLSNRAADRRVAKYQLVHTVRTHRGASDQSYGCVTQEEDAEGHVGVSLSKQLMSVAGEALRTNITTLGPLVLPLSEQLRFLASVLLKRVFRADVKPYLPDFKLALEHFCIHAGARRAGRAGEEPQAQRLAHGAIADDALQVREHVQQLALVRARLLRGQGQDQEGGPGVADRLRLRVQVQQRRVEGAQDGGRRRGEQPVGQRPRRAAGARAQGRARRVRRGVQARTGCLVSVSLLLRSSTGPNWSKLRTGACVRPRVHLHSAVWPGLYIQGISYILLPSTININIYQI